MLVQQQKWINRQEQILSSLDKLTYATREQLQIIEGLGGERNAHRILLRMEKDKIISSYRMERKVYYLSSRGKEQIGSTQAELKRSWIKHTLMRNDLYIKLGMPNNWQKEIPIRFNGVERFVIPDAMFNVENKMYLIEIDNQQQMKVNYDKIERYGQLFKAMFKEYKEHPVLVWSTLSDIRRDKLEEACDGAGIKHKIY